VGLVSLLLLPLDSFVLWYGNAQESQSKLSGSEGDKLELSRQLAESQQAVADRDQALDVLADELVEAAAAQEDLVNARQQAEEQVCVGSGCRSLLLCR